MFSGAVAVAVGIGDGDADATALRGLRSAFNVSHATAKPAAEVMAEVKRVITMNRIQCQFDGLGFAGVGVGASGGGSGSSVPTVLSCEKGPIRFEMEVVGGGAAGERLVRMKRVAGDSWAYKNLCNRIIPQLRL